MKKVISNIKKKCRGFTVAEVVIALTVIVIVSGASMTLVAMQARNEVRAVQTIEATNIAENAIECFRYADGDAEKFKSAFFNEYSGYTLVGSGTSEDPYTVTKDGVTVNIEISGNTITVSATNANNVTILGKTTYTKQEP